MDDEIFGNHHPSASGNANLTAFTAHVNAHYGTRIDHFSQLYAWSVAEPEDFGQR